MASDSVSSKSLANTNHTTTTFRWSTRRKILFRRRRILPIVRLGGTRPRRGFSLVRIFRRARLKWLKLKYSCMLKKLRDYYRSLVKDIMEGGGTIDSFQQRLLLETSFAIPVMGMSFNSFPNNSAV